MVQAHDSILRQQPPVLEGLARTRMTGDEGNWMITDIVEHHGDERIDLHSNGGLSEDQQERVYKPVAATTSQGSSETLVSEDSTILPRPSGENKSVLRWWLCLLSQADLRARDTFSRIVEFVIDGKKAIVHEHLLCEISGFFERSSRHKTSQTPLSFSVRDYASDIEWDTLMVFVKWVYFNELYDKVGLGEDPPNWNELLDLYFIADKWEITVLKNLLVDVLAGQFEESYDFPCYCTKKIWSNTAPGASLRRLWVDFYQFGISGTEFRDEMKSNALDLDFLKELSLSVIIDSREVGFDPDNTPHFIDSSMYHVADDVTGTCCCRVRFEGHEYTHKFQYKRALDHQRWRRRMNKLEGQVKSSEKKAESLQLTLVAKEISLLDKEEYKNWDSKAKELEDQLAKLKESKLKSEQSKNKRIKHLETSLEDTQNLMRAPYASKDRDVFTVDTGLKAVEEKSRAKNKEIQNQKHEIANANAKKRKADSDSRSGRWE